MFVQVLHASMQVCVQIKSEISQGSFVSVLMDTLEHGVKRVGASKFLFQIKQTKIKMFCNLCRKLQIIA